MAGHTGVDLYTCKFCPKTFKYLASLSTHRRSLHPKEVALMQKAKDEKYAKEKELLNSSKINNK